LECSALYLLDTHTLLIMLAHLFKLSSYHYHLFHYLFAYFYQACATSKKKAKTMINSASAQYSAQLTIFMNDYTCMSQNNL